MKKTLILIPFLLFCMAKNIYSVEPKWNGSEKIIQSIEETRFPAEFYNIIDFGAKEGLHTLSTEAINLAIITCNQNGGGTVIVPKGEFLTGPIVMKSNVNLYIEEGGVLKFSTDDKLYMPAVFTRWEGIDCYNTSPLIYAYGETNMAITGKGVIDGQASKEHWWPWNGNPRFGWKEGIPHQKGGSRDRLQKYAEQIVPVSERIMGLEDALRPQLVNFIFCNKVLIEEVTFLNSPFWVIHPLFCKNLIIRGVKIHSLGPNGDGCDPESCSNVLIEKCYFDTGDDCIAIKSGRNADGRRWNSPSENIVIRDCIMKRGHGGVVIGSEISGGCRNLYVENCQMDNQELNRVIRIKTNTCRGGVIENIYVRNIEVGQCKEAVLKINLDYQPDEECDRSYLPMIRNVFLEHMTCQKSKYGVFIIGLKDSSKQIDNIKITNCQFNNVNETYNITGASNVKFTNVIMNGEKIKY
ncbi:glycoside hydrolase family 28 protein [Bacteroides thetaiotaomicron]|uniref:glycoside hydrolase family 28 protein n=1 Tax=Bacteroides thetaiotaomicron TaxID=818 RepID=UPI003A847D43